MKSGSENKSSEYTEFCNQLAPTKKERHDLSAASRPGKKPPLIKPLRKELFFSNAINFFEMWDKNNADISSKKETIQSIDDIQKGNFIIGEAHNDLESKEFLIKNMQTLSDAGFKTLYFEHLYYDDQQALDDYFKNPEEEMPSSLKERLHALDVGHLVHTGHKTNESSKLYNKKREEFNFTNVVKAAAMAGIRVVAIDIKAVYETQKVDLYSARHDESEMRYRAMNYTAYQIIERDQQINNNGNKWMALVGEAHVHRVRKDIPGVADLFNATSVYFAPPRSHAELDAREAKIETNAQYKKLDHVFKGDVIITCPPNAPIPELSKTDDLRLRDSSKVFRKT